MKGQNKAFMRQLESSPEARCPGGLRFVYHRGHVEDYHV
jgi:hypothetical protein